MWYFFYSWTVLTCLPFLPNSSSDVLCLFVDPSAAAIEGKEQNTRTKIIPEALQKIQTKYLDFILVLDQNLNFN